MQYLNKESDNKLFFPSSSSLSSFSFESFSKLLLLEEIGNLYLIDFISGYFLKFDFSVSDGM